jgi:hypothetical protein
MEKDAPLYLTIRGQDGKGCYLVPAYERTGWNLVSDYERTGWKEMLPCA